MLLNFISILVKFQLNHKNVQLGMVSVKDVSPSREPPQALIAFTVQRKLTLIGIFKHL